MPRSAPFQGRSSRVGTRESFPRTPCPWQTIGGPRYSPYSPAFGLRLESISPQPQWPTGVGSGPIRFDPALPRVVRL